MATLYRNYTVIVQDSDSPYYPKSDLELLLYEGQLEIKPDPSAGGDNAVYVYGTTTKATAVLNRNSVASTATVSDSTNNPGEYTFEDIDLDATSSGNAGTTLYSVVARPTADSSIDSFARAKIIVENTDISDPNIKQVVKSSVGGFSDITDNIGFAGGTVSFERYSTSVTNNATQQHLKLTNLPTAVSALVETVSTYPAYGSSTRLTARFNIFYTDTDGTYYAIWNAIPAYKASDSSWVIKVSGDEYNVLRSHAFGSTPVTQIDLGSVYTDFKIAISLGEDNIHVRNFVSTPTSTIPTVSNESEKVCIHTFTDGSGNRVVGVGDWTYSDVSTTPSYNLDVKGSLGTRVQTSGNTQILLSPTSVGFGYSISGMAVRGLYATNTAINVGYNTSTYPVLNCTSTYVRMFSSANTYIEAASSQINAYINAISIIEGTTVSSKFGYNIGGVSESYFGSSSTTGIMKTAGVTKISSTTTTLLLGNSISSYPRLNFGSTDAYIYGGTNDYLHITSTGPAIYGKSNSIQFLSATGGTNKFGYQTDNSSSGIYSHTTSSVYYIYRSGSISFAATGSGVFVGANSTTYPRLSCVGTTYARLEGASGTYAEASSSAVSLVFSGGGQTVVNSTSASVRYGNTVSTSRLDIATSTVYLYNHSAQYIGMDGDDMFIYSKDASSGIGEIKMVVNNQGSEWMGATIIYNSGGSSYDDRAVLKIPLTNLTSDPTSSDSSDAGGLFCREVGSTMRLYMKRSSSGWAYIDFTNI